MTKHNTKYPSEKSQTAKHRKYTDRRQHNLFHVPKLNRLIGLHLRIFVSEVVFLF